VLIAVNSFFSMTNASSFVVFILLFLVVLIFLRFILFSKLPPSSTTLKLLGGLTVFIVALLSENDLVIFASLFIGGLIIASEEFMQNLAIIFRSNSADIGKNLHTTRASKAEMQQKRKADAEQLSASTAESGEKQSTKSSTRSSVQKLTKTAVQAEELVSEYFEKKFGELYEREMRVSGPLGTPTVVVSGVLRTLDNTVYSLVEIAYVLGFEQIPPVLEQVVQRLQPMLSDQRALICIVADAELFTDSTAALEVFDSLKELNAPHVGLLLFSLDKNAVTPVFGDPFISE
jgi:hypothetical protein